MICLIAGTKDAENILDILNKYTDDIAVSTATAYGSSLIENYKVKVINSHPLDEDDMKKWIKKNNINLLIDASHPYAKSVSENAENVCECLNIEYIRYQRKGVLEDKKDDFIIRTSSYIEAYEASKGINGNILNTTGSNNAEKFKSDDFKYRMILRVLPNEHVIKKVRDAGYNVEDIIAMKGPVSKKLEEAFIDFYNVKALITKDSGIYGGALEKYEACREKNIKLIIIERPYVTYKNCFYEYDELEKYLKEKIKSDF